MTREKLGVGKSGGVVIGASGSAAYDSDFSASTLYDDADDDGDFEDGFDDEEESAGFDGGGTPIGSGGGNEDDRMREDMGF